MKTSDKDRFGETYIETKSDVLRDFFKEHYDKYKNPIWIIAVCIGIVLLILYFSVFFQRGILIENNFFKQIRKGNITHYISNGSYGKAEVVVRNRNEQEFTVDYKMPKNEQLSYDLAFIKNENLHENLVIKQDDKVIFDGMYDDNSYLLLDKNGVPTDLDSLIDVTVTYSNELLTNPYENYSPPLHSVATIAKSKNVQTRGQWWALLISIIMTAILVIDIKYPLAFFTLEHFLAVDNPQPSDFYITMQHLSWALIPVFIVIIMLVGLIPNI